METEQLKLNLLALAASGLLMLLTGLGLLIFRDEVSKNLRFFLPIPPIAVAAYIFVFNMFSYYDGSLPGNLRDTLRELTTGTLILSVVFFIFIAAIAAITYILKGLL